MDNIRILVVDDSSFMRNLIKGTLVKEGYEIVGEAQDGAEAVELYKKFKPDVVTMDITMEKMNGIEAVKKIMEFDPDAKIIMVSALGQEDFVKEAIKNGAADFIVKPFDANRLKEAVGNVLT